MKINLLNIRPKSVAQISQEAKFPPETLLGLRTSKTQKKSYIHIAHILQEQFLKFKNSIHRTAPPPPQYEKG